jgi:hypothetical protein
MERLPDETKPETGKLEDFSSLIPELREIETECEVDTDMTDIHSCLVEVLGGNRYRQGEILHRYRVAVSRHGAWLPACQVFGKYFGITERTVRAIAADYARVAGVPAEVIAELELADIDPAAKRNADVVDMAQQLNAAGQPSAEAVRASRLAKAKARAADRKAQASAVWKGGRQLTREEKWTLASFTQQVKGVKNVPPDRRPDILVNGAAVALWHCGCREPIRIVPRETIDLADNVGESGVEQ